MFKPSITDLFHSSIRSIFKNKSRTVLTSLGIVIGVTSVIMLTSIGNGLKNYINDQFESLGSTLIFVVPGKVFNDKGGFNQNESARFITTSFDLKDVQKLKRGLKSAAIMPVKQTPVEAKSAFGSKSNVSLVATTADYGQNTNSLPDIGRWFTKEEYDKKASLVVAGFEIASDLFPKTDPLYKSIYVKGKKFKIIGIIPKKGSSFGGPNLDQHLYVPLETSFSMASDQKIQQIVIKATNANQIDETKEQTKTIMEKRYDSDAFSVFDSRQLLNSINSIIGTLTIALTGIAAISLIVGGIGIMNIMLVTVTERTREIGLRKAIGAYPRAILLQFLFEAVILSLVGGVLGVALGSLGTYAISRAFPAQITFGSVLLAFGVSGAVGIVFGVAPARKASRLSPIEALRYE